MEFVTSQDGTRIAYDRYGSGPAVILVGGALSQRKFKKIGQLGELLAEQGFTVINYDRRGRGDSGNTEPFTLQREVEDIEALIDAVGGSASLWGWSSGGALALRAAAAGIGVERVAVYESPFMVDPDEHLPAPDYIERVEAAVAAGRRAEAVRLFMRDAIGVPAPFVVLMRLMPMWKDLKAVAHTLPYDWAALGAHNMRGEPLDPEEWAGVTVPALIAYGSKSPGNLSKGNEAIAEALPNAELVVLQGQTHNVSMEVLAPVLADFLAVPSPRALAHG